MKKNVLVFLICISSACVMKAQKTSYGLTAGLHVLSQKISIENIMSNSTNHTGFFIGFFAEYQLSKKISIQPTLQYASATTSNDSFNQLLIPIAFKYSVAPKFNLQLITQIDINLNQLGNSEDVRAFGFDIGPGIGFDISKNIYLSSSYTIGLLDQIKNSTLFVGGTSITLSSKFNTFQIGLGYRF